MWFLWLLSATGLSDISASWERSGSVRIIWTCPHDGRCGPRPTAAHMEGRVASVEVSEARDSTGAPGDAESAADTFPGWEAQ